MSSLILKTPRWSKPLLRPSRYKGAKGGRSSGKSHFFAEALVEESVIYPDLQSVCVREIQKSLKFSAKKLIETKIKEMKVKHLFRITDHEIRRIGGDGIIIFQGMQDHTADSIKSLEGFDRLWAEEAQSLSNRSMELLIPTIRKPGSELWFSWNPDQPDDAVEELFRDNPKAALVTVNYYDNPWCPREMIELAEWQKARDLDRYRHIWLGEYDLKSESKVFAGDYVIEEFEPERTWQGPYHGVDFGFSQDPTVCIRCWLHDNTLYIDYEAGKVGLELDHTPDYFIKRIPNLRNAIIRCDSSRPDSISYLKRHGLPKARAASKGSGSVKDGIALIKSFDRVVIHPRCVQTAEEFRMYSYKVDRRSGKITTELVDDHNHYIDALRYATEPLLKVRGGFFTKPR